MVMNGFYFNYLKVQLIMPPTLKMLIGHIAFGACVCECVGHTFLTYCNF